MLNQRPIFLHAFARGGSNIFMNLLLSHPDVCISSGETHKVFKGTKWDSLPRKIKKRVFFDWPIRLLVGQDILSPECLAPRKAVPKSLQGYIDRILYDGRFTAIRDSHNLYRHEGVPYTKEELARCRLLTKGLNGVVYTVDLFKEMYPDAVFLGLVRNGLAVCEGHVRRGWTARETAQMYESVARKMLQSSDQMDNYYLCRYEEMVQSPLEFMHQIYGYAGLDMAQVRKARLQSKKVMNRDGKRTSVRGDDRQVFWYELSELHLNIRRDVNENQIRQLKDKDKETFLSIAGGVMKQLGYNGF